MTVIGPSDEVGSRGIEGNWGKVWIRLNRSQIGSGVWTHNVDVPER